MNYRNIISPKVLDGETAIWYNSQLRGYVSANFGVHKQEEITCWKIYGPMKRSSA